MAAPVGTPLSWGRWFKGFFVQQDPSPKALPTPKKIATFLDSVRDPAARAILQQVDEMPTGDKVCHVAANEIHGMIAQHAQEAGTSICGNYIVKVRAHNIQFPIHIINVFTVRGERKEAEMLWYAVDKNTNSSVFPGCSESQLQSQLLEFYNSTRDRDIWISNQPIKGWTASLPEWRVGQMVPWPTDAIREPSTDSESTTVFS